MTFHSAAWLVPMLKIQGLLRQEFFLNKSWPHLQIQSKQHKSSRLQNGSTGSMFFQTWPTQAKGLFEVVASLHTPAFSQGLLQSFQCKRRHCSSQIVSLDSALHISICQTSRNYAMGRRLLWAKNKIIMLTSMSGFCAFPDSSVHDMLHLSK